MHRSRPFLVTVACLLAAPAIAGAQQQPRTPDFQDLWQLLDAARAYRTGFVLPRQQGELARVRAPGAFGVAQMRGNYLDDDFVQVDSPTFPNTSVSPRTALLRLLGRDPAGQPLAGDSFAARLAQSGSIAFQREAAQGYQEALGDFIAGETLIANESLLQGLRTRYRVESSPDPEDQSQLGLLTQSRNQFLAALRIAADEARRNAPSLRAGDPAASFQFPFFVENTPPTSNGVGELVESELYRLTDLVNRYGIAHNALAKRKFFFGNDTPAGRADAAGEFKTAAQNSYLGSVLLAASQTEKQFQDNNGGELDRQITIAQQLYDDILSGFNPLTLLGDFVPAQSTNGIFDLLEVQLQTAVCAENKALELQRNYDEDLTELQAELLDQSEAYIDQIDILLGLVPPFDGPGDECAPPEELLCNPALPADRDAILALADDTAGQKSIEYLEGCDATICNNHRAWRAANIELEAAQRAQEAIVEQMQIEEERAGAVTRIIRDGATRVAILEVAKGIAAAAVPDMEFDPSDLGVPTLSYSLSGVVAAAFDAGIVGVEAATEIELENTESAAVLKNLFLELVAQEINKRRAALAVVEARAEYTASIGDLKRFLRNYATAAGNFEEAYFTNPAYQVALDRAIQNADASFEAAMVTAYKATKALEYEWAERLLNPVVDPNGPDRPIGDAALYNGILSAESAFKVRSAGNPGLPDPSLQTYVQALQAWDSTMREVRGPLRQEGQTRLVQLRRDVLGFDSPDLAFNRLAFRSHLASRRVPGFNALKDDLELAFPLQILDQRIFPAVPNLKIQNLSLDLRPLPGREVVVPPSPNPPLINVIHDDQAFLRTFFADYPEDDDFLTVDLEGSRSFRQSQFFAQVEATLNGVGSAAPNTQLARRSPAVSRWSLNFEMDNGVNRDLVLENLDDIWIRITYAFGQPVEFDFPDILACPN
jgi:hypothetical protein